MNSTSPTSLVGAEATIAAEGTRGRRGVATVEEIADVVVPRQTRPEDPGRPSDTRVLPVWLIREANPLKLGQRVEVEIAGGKPGPLTLSLLPYEDIRRPSPRSPCALRWAVLQADPRRHQDSQRSVLCDRHLPADVDRLHRRAELAKEVKEHGIATVWKPAAVTLFLGCLTPVTSYVVLRNLGRMSVVAAPRIFSANWWSENGC